MRSLSRALVVGALTLPLAFAGMGVASAGGHGDVCNHWSCNWTHIDWTHTTDDDIGIINAGIIG